jgi:hypothetical protein
MDTFLGSEHDGFATNVNVFGTSISAVGVTSGQVYAIEIARVKSDHGDVETEDITVTSLQVV